MNLDFLNFRKKKKKREKPLRDMLLSVEQLKLHAKSLAVRHKVDFKKTKDKLLNRLKENRKILLEISEDFDKAGKAKKRISPASEWLLDNFYLIEEEIRLSQKHLPKGYSKELPSLKRGTFKGLPRAYALAFEAISHSDGKLDIKNLTEFLHEYQKIKQLRIGELWAIPIMIRLALIENIRRVSLRMAHAQEGRDQADYWANRFIEIPEKDIDKINSSIEDLNKSNITMSRSFVSELVRRVYGKSTNHNLVISWLERKLASENKDIESLIQATSSKQAADQVSISNSIESLRLLESTDWKDFVENLSVVEETLRKDPASVYTYMDFDTRDEYRHVIESLSRRSQVSEFEVANHALTLANNAFKLNKSKQDLKSHVGYYLKHKGLEELCESLKIRLTLNEYIQTKRFNFFLVFYLGFIGLFTFLSSAGLVYLMWFLGITNAYVLSFIAALLLITTSQTAISVINFLSTIIVKPKQLPRMNFSEGIPKKEHTLVVIPTMLSSLKCVDDLVDDLEIRYLANVDANLDFALLTDFPDAKVETLPDDDDILRYAEERIEKLNYKYRRYKDSLFYLLHRPRLYNKKEKIWMAYERKRGKLIALNALLRGEGKENFSLIVGNVDKLQSVKYVITLDTDTFMHRDTARKLVSVIAHPLNRPIYDEKKKRIVSGYGILQPRVDLSYPGDRPSLFIQLFGGETGIDPYTKAVSDVYQDLFNEGSFIGKGLYDVDAFEKVLHNKLPENLILSHDLLEGCYARSGLVTDVQLYEEYPSCYLKDVSRRTRWIRGDWQILKWLFNKVPNFENEKEKNPLSLLSRWKIFDNLRRSLFPIANLLLFLIGFCFYYHPWFWFALLASFVCLPVIFIASFELFKKPNTISIKDHFCSIFDLYIRRIIQFICFLCFMVYEASFSLSSILKANWRMFISKTKLLEWKAFSEYDLNAAKSVFDFYRIMFVAPLMVIGFLFFLFVLNKPINELLSVLLSFWFLSPGLAYLLTKNFYKEQKDLEPDALAFLSKSARKIWNFFETFVDKENNWLPPDNYQEEHIEKIAKRTSPTNIGLYLLSSLSAYDFGYISMGQMFYRTEKTINTLNSMERYKGHFYNWYDTETLMPLEPRYVSSVDSGNLIGHLLVLKSGLLEMSHHPIVSEKVFDGLNDSLSIIYDCLSSIDSKSDDFKNIKDIYDSIKGKTLKKPVYLSEIYTLLRQLATESSKLVSILNNQNFNDLKKWSKAFEKQCYDYIEDIRFIAPWLLLVEEPNLWDAEEHHQKKILSDLRKLFENLDNNLSLTKLLYLLLEIKPILKEVIDNTDKDSEKQKKWFTNFREIIQEAISRTSDRINAINYIALRCGELADIEYEFLYNKNTKLLSIGYNVKEHKIDSSCYDLLASEARLASYVGIANGKIPQESWFLLSRMVSKHGSNPVLLSWGGSMFEYLMPLLVMPNYKGTLLDKTYKASVASQIKYGKANSVPWGISESAYNKLDPSKNYQYQSFGVPYIGFKRGLSEDLVVSPYSSFLALMVEPKESYLNLKLLEKEGALGDYGYYEAIDYTASRLSHGQKYEVVKSYMAHHQGMSFLSLAYLLLNKPMQKRFLADPMFKTTELLLQEKVPKEISTRSNIEISGLLKKFEEREMLFRLFTSPNTPTPEIHMLSNGRYNAMLTNSGGGYSKWNNLAINRWREDSTMDRDGSFIYIHDLENNDFWSTSYQPTKRKPEFYEALFSQSRVEFKRTDNDIETHTKVAVSPEDDIELRRVTITNRSSKRRVLEVTSYFEVVLNYPENDLAHRTFSNLFIETEIIKSHQAIICKRRPRSEDEEFPLLLHLMAVHGNTLAGASYETDRSKFIKRGNSISNPYSIYTSLSNTEGAVLDPCASIRTKIELRENESTVIDYVTGVANNRQNIDLLIEKYRDKNLADRVFDLAWTHGQIVLDQMNATEADAQVYGRLASAIVYTKPEWRASPSILKQNRRGQSDLWGHSISGDLPIVLVKIRSQENIKLVERMIQAHTYWNMKGLAVDLVIWNEDASVYRDVLGEIISGLIYEKTENRNLSKGSIFLKRPDQMSEEDKVLIQSVAKIIISDRYGSLNQQVEKIMSKQDINLSKLKDYRQARDYKEAKLKTKVEKGVPLLYYNGVGGFTKDGKEYVVNVSEDIKTPAPWVNILANENFGTVVSESSNVYTWSENAHGFRLTPWKNDTVSDNSGELIYIRDEKTGKFWCPTILARGKGEYKTRHGFGYTVFEHQENGISSELTVFVSLNDSIKFSILKLKNNTNAKKSLSVSSYNELVMGTLREKNYMYIQTDFDHKTNSLIAYNYYNKEFSDRVCFHNTNQKNFSFTTDRKDFIGRNNNYRNPNAMYKEKLFEKIGAGLDPCFVLQSKIELAKGSEKEIIFTFGSGKNLNDAKKIIDKYKTKTSVKKELKKVKDFWDSTLGRLSVETSDKAIDLMVNGWLQYQNISSRLWARTGFYQSSGAYGFRDQLQDVLSLIYLDPKTTRKQIVKFASRQFIEGDVQHWWHPQTGAGIRSHCSDDYLWLPFVTASYVEETGDIKILDEEIGFLDGPNVDPDKESNYSIPDISHNKATLYEHCVLSVKRALKYGVHGLPFIGTCDWNDGMNLVGHKGRGESVWLGFFLLDILKKMVSLSNKYGDIDFSNKCIDEASKLIKSIEKNAWDGNWYKRAFFDNGKPLGSIKNQECKIDSIAQSWAVISGFSKEERKKEAMKKVDEMLIDHKNSIIKLFTPAFDKMEDNPGYIKGYVPGVRENGGQYTHAAAWTVIAFSILKDKDMVSKLLNIINPINHALSYDTCNAYKVEPYVMAADIYTADGHTGRGGWTWYTGSASWMYQLIVKYVIGLKLRGDTLFFDPCLPKEWKTVKVKYKYLDTTYDIEMKQMGKKEDSVLFLNGKKQKDINVKLVNDKKTKNVRLKI